MYLELAVVSTTWYNRRWAIQHTLWKSQVLRCSICSGEQVAGFKNIHTGKFEEIMLIRNKSDLDTFMKIYDIDTVTKEY